MLESYEKQLGKFWPRVVETTAGGHGRSHRRGVRGLRRWGAGLEPGEVTMEARPSDFEDCARSNRFEINLGAIAVAMPRKQALRR